MTVYKSNLYVKFDVEETDSEKEFRSLKGKEGASSMWKRVLRTISQNSYWIHDLNPNIRQDLID